MRKVRSTLSIILFLIAGGIVANMAMSPEGIGGLIFVGMFVVPLLIYALFRWIATAP